MIDVNGNADAGRHEDRIEALGLAFHEPLADLVTAAGDSLPSTKVPASPVMLLVTPPASLTTDVVSAAAAACAAAWMAMTRFVA